MNKDASSKQRRRDTVGANVPRKPTKRRAPDESVPVQLYMPNWLKERAQGCAKREAQELSAWLRAIILAAVEERERRAHGK